MAHKNHPDCIYTSLAACERARKAALGRCAEMTADKRTPKPCSHWADSIVAGRPICNQHATAVLSRELEAQRVARVRAALDDQITQHMTWIAEHPSVWDSRRCPG
jgi:hypothetical protein